MLTYYEEREIKRKAKQRNAIIAYVSLYLSFISIMGAAIAGDYYSNEFVFYIGLLISSAFLIPAIIIGIIESEGR